MISYAKVTIHSHTQVWIKNFIENQQTIILVIEAIAIHHNIGKSQYKSESALYRLEGGWIGDFYEIFTEEF